MADDTAGDTHRRIVLFCDGTWKKSDDPEVSNIKRLKDWTLPEDHAGRTQIKHYQPGVGAATTWLPYRWWAGGVGAGLDQNVEEMYYNLAGDYQPGDEIFIFGFSRGAFTARSLVGMIDRIGILTAVAMDNPDENMLARARQIYENGDHEAAKQFKSEFSHSAKVAFLGVFDTVGALGVPVPLWGSHKKSFHSVQLSDSVECGRQALAIDERRRTFLPAVWQAEAGTVSPDRVRQVWFPGVHSDIGGGYEKRGLAQVTLRWMAHEAMDRGLVLDRERLDTFLGKKYSRKRNNSFNFWYKVFNPFQGHNIEQRPRMFKGRRVLQSATWVGTTRMVDVNLRVSSLVHSPEIKKNTERFASPNLGWLKAEIEDAGQNWDDLLEVTPEGP